MNYLLEAQDKELRRRKTIGYIFYPMFPVMLWFSDSMIYTLTFITLTLIYVLSHQVYFFIKEGKHKQHEVSY